MVKGPLWFSLVCVSLIFRLIMGVKDVGGECIGYEYRPNAISATSKCFC